MKEKNTLTIAMVIILGFLLLGGFGMVGFAGMGGMMGTFNYGFGGMWIFGWLFMSLIVIALVLFIAWLIKQIQIVN